MMAAGDPVAAETKRHHLVVVGASAGGIEALRSLVGALPEDFPAAILVVVHLAPAGTSVLPQILTRAGTLQATAAVDGEPIEGGHIYVAPPDCHLLVEDGKVRVTRGPTVNGHRPAVDPLFRSAAASWGDEVAGVVLSGVLDDGTAGLAAIKAAGGLTLVQDPAEALYSGMPDSAIAFVQPDMIASAAELGRALAAAADEPPPDPPADHETNGNTFIEVDRGATEEPYENAAPTGLSCPYCNGGIWLTREHGVDVFRCRVGHEFSPEALHVEQSGQVEQALWTALRALEEHAAMSRRIAQRMTRGGHRASAARFARRADQTVQQATIIRRVLESPAFAAADAADELDAERAS
jgi:two-component system chemotaxis response regulator CheB